MSAGPEQEGWRWSWRWREHAGLFFEALSREVARFRTLETAEYSHHISALYVQHRRAAKLKGANVDDQPIYHRQHGVLEGMHEQFLKGTVQPRLKCYQFTPVGTFCRPENSSGVSQKKKKNPFSDCFSQLSTSYLYDPPCHSRKVIWIRKHHLRL